MLPSFLYKEENSFIEPKTRLARNRRTARLRRERKKQEAELLTCALNDALTELNNYKAALDSNSKKDLESFLISHQMKIQASGCLFCEKHFLIFEEDKNSELKKHYIGEHAHDIKSSFSYLGKNFLELIKHPQQLIDLIEKLSKESANKVLNNTERENEELICMPSANADIYRRLTSEEKKKRRLERNAESARLCRQRKKLYIQKIRLQLPRVNREKELVLKFMQQISCDLTTVEKARRPSVIPKLNGWDNSMRKNKRNLSYNDLNNVEMEAKRLNLTSCEINLMTPMLDLNSLSQTLNQIHLVNSMGCKWWNTAQNFNTEKDVVEAAFALTTLGTKEDQK